MKILIIGPNVGMGGVERASCNLANGFVEAGHTVYYLALIQDELFFDLKANYIQPDSFNQTTMNLFRTILYIRKHTKQIKPDSIICFTKFYAAISNIALIFSKFKIFVTERSSPLYKWPLKIEIFSKLSFSIRRPIGVISQTSFASEYHKKYFGKTKYCVIPNAVRDVKLYPEIKREQIILAVGRFNDSCKGFDLLVKAFNQLKNDSWRLVFAGGDRKEGQYLLDCANDNVKTRIDFLGSIKEIDKQYARTGIFVIPSRSEGFPNSLAESMVAGCCCVSFDFIAGPRDLIENGENGIIVDNGNIDKLADVIDNLIIDTNLRNTLAAKSRSVYNYLNIEAIVNRHLLFLNEN